MVSRDQNDNKNLNLENLSSTEGSDKKSKGQVEKCGFWPKPMFSVVSSGRHQCEKERLGIEAKPKQVWESHLVMDR